MAAADHRQRAQGGSIRTDRPGAVGLAGRSREPGRRPLGRLAGMLAALLLALGSGMPAMAQTAGAFPSRVVTLVVPFTAGSGSDILARILGPLLAERWGRPVVVDNRAGASGNIGADFVAKAPPDGHTLLMAINTMTMAANLYRNLPFDPLADFEPVGRLATGGYMLVAHPGVSATDLRAFLAMVRAAPGRSNYASPGVGTPHHLAMELFKLRGGFDVVHVPYKGLAGAVTDLLGGQVQVMFASVHSVLPHVQAGRLRPLAITGEQRSALVPAVGTFREQGFDTMDSIDSWYAVIAPARTSTALVARLNSDFAAVIGQPSVREQLKGQGLVVATNSPEAMKALLRDDLVRWGRVVTEARISAE